MSTLSLSAARKSRVKFPDRGFGQNYVGVRYLTAVGVNVTLTVILLYCGVAVLTPCSCINQQ